MNLHHSISFNICYILKSFLREFSVYIKENVREVCLVSMKDTSLEEFHVSPKTDVQKVLIKTSFPPKEN